MRGSVRGRVLALSADVGCDVVLIEDTAAAVISVRLSRTVDSIVPLFEQPACVGDDEDHTTTPSDFFPHPSLITRAKRHCSRTVPPEREHLGAQTVTC